MSWLDPAAAPRALRRWAGYRPASAPATAGIGISTGAGASAAAAAAPRAGGAGARARALRGGAGQVELGVGGIHPPSMLIAGGSDRGPVYILSAVQTACKTAGRGGGSSGCISSISISSSSCGGGNSSSKISSNSSERLPVRFQTGGKALPNHADADADGDADAGHWGINFLSLVPPRDCRMSR